MSIDPTAAQTNLRPRTLAQIAADPRVESIYREYDYGWSWWCYLQPGIITDVMECGTIHEDTIAAVARVLRGARPAVKGEECLGYHPDREARAIALCAPFKPRRS